MGSGYINYFSEVKGSRSFLNQKIPLVFPGKSQSQSVEEEAPIGSPLPSSATSEPGDLFLTKEDVELNSTPPARKCPNHAGPDAAAGSGDGSPPPVEELVRLASLHLQSLIKERAACEEILTPGISSSSSQVKGGKVEQLLEDAREEQERLLSFTEKVELLTGVPQSRMLRQGLDTWGEEIREIDGATTNNQNVTAIINKMIGTIRRIRTHIWTLASTSS